MNSQCSGFEVEYALDERQWSDRNATRMHGSRNLKREAGPTAPTAGSIFSWEKALSRRVSSAIRCNRVDF